MNIISEYKFAEELRKGRNSLVYRGYREVDGQPVILKMLNQTYPSPENLGRFKLEYEITHSLNPAPNAGQAVEGVVKAYDLRTDQNRWVMVLEDFGGVSLDRFAQYPHFTLTEILRLAIQIVDILDKVHQQHVVHKDINPSNIVLNRATGQLKLIDFGIATTLTRENPALRNPNVIEGTLAYMSPEQTGRMNRAIDYRTDFYSLGVTFYELLTGRLPFVTDDVLALVHAHIAKQPPPPHELDADIPPPISDIVMKLMAKNAEDRYQSAYRLKADLEECLHQWHTTGRIEPFPLRQHDASSQFQIPQKLYGRAEEIDLLLAAFERVSRGANEIMIVSGYTGIGKTSLVQEVYKPITRQRGYFIRGKFDQLQRNIPYASLIQAFRFLVRQLLTENEEEIGVWRRKLLEALGQNGQVIIKVIPEVELIIGPQPDLPELPPVEAQNRFNLVFQNFIKVFTRPEHPLVLFLDDLQWADGASLKLIEVLLTTGASDYLFLIGAYRDNEVGPGHPLMLALDAIREAGTTINHVSLLPLAPSHIVQLIADTLYCTPAQAQPLAELILAKTQGNPFFINEFLKSLWAAKLLTFDFSQGRWQWDLAKIQAQQITDNVAELMSEKVRRLGDRTQQVLKLAACIGNQFDLQTLATVYEQSPQQTASDLWDAIAQEFILPLGDAYKLMNLEVEGLAEAVIVEYKFAHDQVQQAAYALIPGTARPDMHRRVGQLLLQNTPQAEQDQKIFDIVNHLNLGRGLLSQPSERNELAALNLQAGKKAKMSAAYQPAFNYLQVGLELLAPAEAPGSWQQQYDLTLTMFVEATEAAYLNAAYDQMEQLGEVVLQQATTLLDKVSIYEIKVQAYIAQNKWPEALRTGLFILRQLGVKFPEKPQTWHIILALIRTKLALAGKRIENFKNLPEMRDPVKLAAMRILRVISGAAFISTPQLFPLIVFKQVNLSVKYGNTAGSSLAYAAYAIILCGVVKDIDSGYQFGQLALDVLERFNARAIKAQILFIEHFFIRPWKEPIRATLKSLLETHQSGLESGDLEFAANAISVYVTSSFFVGRELAGFEQELASYREVLAKLKQERTLYFHNLYWQTVLNLRDDSELQTRLTGEKYDEAQMLSLHFEANDLNAVCHVYLIKLILCYLSQEYSQALESAVQLEKYLDAFTGMYTTAVFYFYNSLARLALSSEVSKVEQKKNLKRVAANQKKIKKWAGHAPMNFLHKFYLVEAERARVLGYDKEARDYYDRAIALARQNEYVNEEALACELAGKFYLAQGQDHVARHYLLDAHYAYQRWGAVAKVKGLERRYPQFLVQAGPAPDHAFLATTTSTGRTTSTLDLASVLKASQAISGEIELEKLLTTLMKIIIENAGAQRGYLIMEKKGRWVIEAEGTLEAEDSQTGESGTVRVLQAMPVESSGRLSAAIVNYVARTKENVVLNEASREGLFIQDPYIVQTRPKSVLCAPLVNQGQLTGILYLENNLATNAFTPARLEVLNLLSAQAAISIENARLYSQQVALTAGYSRFVPPEILRFLNKESIVEVKLGDHIQQEMAVLFSDIRAFTTLSETMSAQENFDFVNDYLGRVSPVIRQHGGFIVKYLGDGMMAVFPNRVEDALTASIAKMKQVAAYNEERRQRGEAAIQIGIGIHSGKMMVGTVGETARMQGDLLSDAVNLAARLEGLSKVYGASISISGETLRRLADPTQFNIRFLGKVQVKGRQEAVPVFEVFDGDPAELVAVKVETKTAFEGGLSHYYAKRFGKAREQFEKVLRRNPADLAARLYLERSVQYQSQEVPDDWDGVEVQMDK